MKGSRTSDLMVRYVARNVTWQFKTSMKTTTRFFFCSAPKQVIGPTSFCCRSSAIVVSKEFGLTHDHHCLIWLCWLCSCRWCWAELGWRRHRNLYRQRFQSPEWSAGCCTGASYRANEVQSLQVVLGTCCTYMYMYMYIVHIFIPRNSAKQVCV